MSSIRNVLVSGVVGAVAGAAVTALAQQAPQPAAMDPAPIAEAVSHAVGEAAAKDREVLRRELSRLRMEPSQAGMRSEGPKPGLPGAGDGQGAKAPAGPGGAPEGLLRSSASEKLPRRDLMAIRGLSVTGPSEATMQGAWK